MSLVYRQRKPLSVRNNSDITASRPDLIGERLQRRDHEGSLLSRASAWFAGSVLAERLAPRQTRDLVGWASAVRPDFLVSVSGSLFWPTPSALLAGCLGSSGRRLGSSGWASRLFWSASWRGISGRRSHLAPRCPELAAATVARERHDVKMTRLYAGRCGMGAARAELSAGVRERAVRVVRVVRTVRCGRVLVTTTSRSQRGGWGASANNLMVRSQSACSFQGPGIADSR